MFVLVMGFVLLAYGETATEVNMDENEQKLQVVPVENFIKSYSKGF